MTNKPMLSVSLLPCPFCGAPAELEDHRLIWCVRCTKCSASILGDRAPEPHGDGVSSDEVQDLQAAAMSDSTDWAAYEKSAVDAWNSRNKPSAKLQGDAVAWMWRHATGSSDPWFYPCPPEPWFYNNGSYVVIPLYAEQPAPVEPFSGDTVACRRYQLEQSPGQNFYHYDLEPVYGSVPVTVSELITMVESAPVAVVMPERREPSPSNPHLSDADHEYNIALDDVARLNGVKP